MRRSPVLSILALAMAVAATAQPPQPPRRGGGARAAAPESEQVPPVPNSDAERRILSTLSEIVKAGELYANVPAADGRMLRVLAEAVNAKTVVEIGTSTGISGIWFCLALMKTGGKLHTFELDAGRATLARAHFKKAGVDSLVNLVEGDAHQNITKVKAPVDVVFIDAEKEGYVDYLNKMLPLVRPGGLILAHNVDMVRDYMKEVTAKPELETLVYASGGGLAITLKKR